MTTLLMVRHGQSEANIHNIFAGNFDADLTELGLKQAKVTAEYIHKNYQVDKIYASDLKRAYKTGLAIGEQFDLEVIPNKSLREISAGKWEGLTFEELPILYPEEFGIWLNDIGNSRCVGGESTAELGARILKALEKIALENDGKIVAIATHATPVRVMECLTQNRPIKDLKDISWVSNASVTEFCYDNGKWTIVKRGYDEHLSDLRSTLPPNV